MDSGPRRTTRLTVRVGQEEPMSDSTTPPAPPDTSAGDGSVFDKYRNPDTRCGYPFSPDPCGYCWSFAHHVDGTEGYEDMEKICPGCELFTPNAEHETRRVAT